MERVDLDGLAVLIPASAGCGDGAGPDAARLRDAANELDLPDAAQAAVGRGLADLIGDEDRARLWRRCREYWMGGGPRRIEEARAWPTRTDAAGTMFYALLCLSGVRDGAARLRRRGLPEAVVRASLSDVTRRMQRCVARHGFWGIEQPRWLGRHLQGRLIELGRLQYEVGVMVDKLAGCADEALIAALRRRGWDLDQPVWWLHIPGGSPLSPAAVEESLALARQMLPRCFPSRGDAPLLCRSWILDSQLRQYLPPDANLLRFADRFELIHEPAGDGGFESFPFDAPSTGKLTRLQEAAAEHRRRGGTWRSGLGWLRPG